MNKILPGLNALVLVWQVVTYTRMVTAIELHWVVIVPLAVAIPFGIALFSMIRPPKLRLLAILTNALLLGIVLVLLPVFAFHGVLHYVAAQVLKGDVLWIQFVVFWALYITIAVCNLIRLLRSKLVSSSNLAI